MLIDTHAHLNFNAFNQDRDGVIKRCLENDVWMINIGTNYETSKKAAEIAEKYEKGVYASVGLHPINLDTGLVKMKLDEQEGKHFEKPSTRAKLGAGLVPHRNKVSGAGEFDYDEYKILAQNPKVVAIGEIGLDYYWKPKTTKKKELFKQKQKELFLKELELAKELNLPVILHCRMAHDDLIQTLQHSNIPTIKGVMHGFVGTSEQLQKYLKLGLYIGFNGIIFKKIEGINRNDNKVVILTRSLPSLVFEENIKNTPLDRILIETDCPYLAPPGFPEEKNNPLGVKYIVQKIAEIKNISFEEATKASTENAKNLFKI